MATSTAPSGTSASVVPNQSLYIQNLPEKLQKSDLRRNLYMLFSTYGPVIDITALKTPKMRGQAHILFRDINSAQLAMRNLNNTDFFGREMVSLPFSKARGCKRDCDTNRIVTENILRQIPLPNNRQTHRNFR
jgi:RNA recognition motif-containing protein